MLDTAVRIYRSLIGKKFVWKDGVAFAIGKTMHPDELKFVIFHEGKAVGHAVLTFNKKTAHVAEFFIRSAYQDQKLGSNLIEGINSFLDKYNLRGELVNGIIDPEKEGLYKRHGWREKGIVTYRNPNK